MSEDVNYSQVVPGTFEPNGNHPMCKDCVLFCGRGTPPPEAERLADKAVALLQWLADFETGVIRPGPESIEARRAYMRALVEAIGEYRERFPKKEEA